MSLILDAGAFIAAERFDPEVLTLLDRERHAGRRPSTHGGVVGQVWRGGPRAAVPARLLIACEVFPLDATLGRSAGELLAAAGRRDVIDAALVLIAHAGDRILTSDPDDLAALVAASRRDLDVVAI